MYMYICIYVYIYIDQIIKMLRTSQPPSEWGGAGKNPLRVYLHMEYRILEIRFSICMYCNIYIYIDIYVYIYIYTSHVPKIIHLIFPDFIEKAFERHLQGISKAFEGHLRVSLIEEAYERHLRCINLIEETYERHISSRGI